MAEAARIRNKRRYPRVKAPIFYRSPRLRLFQRQPVIDASLGGIRIYSDTPLAIEQRLDIELFLPDTSSLRCRARVAWIASLPEGAAAKFDVGLELLEIPPGGVDRIAKVLDDATVDLPFA